MPDELSLLSNKTGPTRLGHLADSAKNEALSVSTITRTGTSIAVSAA